MGLFERLEAQVQRLEPPILTLTVKYTFHPETDNYDSEEEWEVIRPPKCKCLVDGFLCHFCWFGEHVDALGWEAVFNDPDRPITWPGRGEQSSKFKITGKMATIGDDDYFVISDLQMATK
jgi:hypothetical protein